MTTRKWKERDIKEAFFEVEKKPIFVESKDLFGQSYDQLPDHFAIVDVKKNKVFSVVTKNYHLVKNIEAYKIAQDIMLKVFNHITLDDLVCLNITMPSTRSFCHIDLIHKNSDFSPWEQDKWTPFLRITNSYNRTRLLRFEVGFCRWICLNGMIFGAKSIELSYTHSRDSIQKIERFAENIGDVRKLEAEMIEKLHHLKRYHVPRKEMLPLACRVFDIKIGKEDIKPKRRESLIAMREQVNKLTSAYFTEMGEHGYAALNVLTDYASRPEGVLAQASAINGLQQKAGDWMDDFISSIKAQDFSFDAYLAEFRETAKTIEALA